MNEKEKFILEGINGMKEDVIRLTASLEAITKERDYLRKLLERSDNSDYAKCAREICSLDLLDDVINKQVVIETILRRHFT